MPGHVYLITEESIKDENSGPWTKIGYSKNLPEWRMNANLKRGNPRNLVVFEVYVYETQTEARKWEKKAHVHFDAFYYQKEWFNIESATISKWFISNGAILRTVKSK